MCTVIVLRRPDHRWPLVMAGNRDEMANRPWQPPLRHWPDRPNVVAGRDELGGGSWMGVNDEGVAAVILNREGTLGPLAGKRSRGELVLEALDHADAVEAARALAELDPDAYRPFNMIVADNRDTYWLRADGKDIRVIPVGEGVSMLTAFELNDPADERVEHFLPLFDGASPPKPSTNDWSAWRALLASPAPSGAKRPQAGLDFLLESGFGTTNSSLLALPSIDRPGAKPIWLFSPGRPSLTCYRPVPV